MRMSVKIKAEHDKVTAAFNYIIKKLKLDYDLTIRPMTVNQLKRNTTVYMTIQRTGRSKQDKNAFMVYFNQNMTSVSTQKQLNRHALHEIFHALTWPFIDEYDESMKHIHNVKLYNELQSRANDTRENVIYTLERKLGPVLLPDTADWSEDAE